MKGKIKNKQRIMKVRRRCCHFAVGLCVLTSTMLTVTATARAAQELNWQTHVFDAVELQKEDLDAPDKDSKSFSVYGYLGMLKDVPNANGIYSIGIKDDSTVDATVQNPDILRVMVPTQMSAVFVTEGKRAVTGDELGENQVREPSYLLSANGTIQNLGSAVDVQIYRIEDVTSSDWYKPRGNQETLHFVENKTQIANDNDAFLQVVSESSNIVFADVVAGNTKSLGTLNGGGSITFKLDGNLSDTFVAETAYDSTQYPLSQQTAAQYVQEHPLVGFRICWKFVKV